MADVTVNINGDASRLRAELDGVTNDAERANQRIDRTKPEERDSRMDREADRRSVDHGSTLPPPQLPTAPTPDTRAPEAQRSYLPSNERMVEDVRREAQQRGTILVPGTSTVSQIVNQYSQGKKSELEAQIASRYQDKRADLGTRREKAYDDVDAEIERRRANDISAMGGKKDPLALQMLEERLSEQRERMYKKVGTQFDDEEKGLADEEKGERDAAERELTEAIKELTNYFNRKSSAGEDPNSYIGKLRNERQAIIAERDSAHTEEGAQEASRRLEAVNEKLASALNGGQSKQGLPVDSALRTGQGLAGMIGSASGGNLGGTIMGAGSAYAGMAGMGLKQALKFLGWVGVAAAVADTVKGAATGASDSTESFAGLGNMRGGTGGHGGALGREIVGFDIHRSGYEGLGLDDLGLTDKEFAAEAFQRSKARGISKDWKDETYKALSLENTFALDQGTLKGGAKYDRYGQNVTDALSRLVSILSDIKDSGVSEGDFTRVQEKFDIQQQIMDSYMYRTDRPNYDTANQTLAAFSSVKGITQDQRVGSDIEAFQNAIQTPMNEKMKALVYGTVADLFPETAGKMDLIDRKIQDPENEGKIMQAVFQRVQQMYGGTDTTMGYFAAKHLLSTIAPDRRDAYLNAMKDGTFTADMLKGNNNVNSEEKKAKYDEDMRTYAKQSAESLTTMSKAWQWIINQKDRSLLDIGGLRTPTPNQTHDGNE